VYARNASTWVFARKNLYSSPPYSNSKRSRAKREREREWRVVAMEKTPTLEEQPKSKPSTSEEEEEEENVDNGDQYMPDAAQNPPSSPGSDGSDSDSEDEAQQNLLLQTLEAELSSNPSNYDAHIKVFTLFAC
jgi:hypothetical protein